MVLPARRTDDAYADKERSEGDQAAKKYYACCTAEELA
jgi:hypothetical protein